MVAVVCTVKNRAQRETDAANRQIVLPSLAMEM